MQKVLASLPHFLMTQEHEGSSVREILLQACIPLATCNFCIWTHIPLLQSLMQQKPGALTMCQVLN